jgi:hypothetical protein
MQLVYHLILAFHSLQQQQQGRAIQTVLNKRTSACNSSSIIPQS